MKKLFILSLYSIFLSSASFAQLKTALIEIDGLTCSLCSYSVQRSIEKLKFINKVEVDLNKNTASVQFNTQTIVNINALIQSIFDAGFSVRSLKVTFDFKDPVRLNNASFVFQSSVFFIVNLTSDRDLKGLVDLTFIKKQFTEGSHYKKYKSSIEKALANIILNESYFFVTI